MTCRIVNGALLQEIPSPRDEEINNLNDREQVTALEEIVALPGVECECRTDAWNESSKSNHGVTKNLLDIVHFNDARAERNVTILPCDLEGTRDFKLQGFYCFFNQGDAIQPDSSTIFIHTNDFWHDPEKNVYARTIYPTLKTKLTCVTFWKVVFHTTRKIVSEEFENDPLYENRIVLANYSETLNISDFGCN